MTCRCFQRLAHFNGKVYASGSFTDFAKPKYEGGYPIEPLLFEWNGSAWGKVAFPGVVPEYYGSEGASVAASESELFYATATTHPGLDNLLAFDGTTWTPRPHPATRVAKLFVTADGTVRLLVPGGLSGLLRYGVLRSR